MIERSNASGEGQINGKFEREVHMKKSIVRGIFAAVVALTAFSARPVMVKAEGNGLHVAIQSSPTSFINADPGTCDPITFAPKTGQPFCIESLTGTTTLSGDFVGSDLDEITILFYANGFLNFSDYESWTGTLAGHGTGSFILFEYDGMGQMNGALTSKVRIVDGTGSGDLVGITGRGTFSGDTSVMTIQFPGQHQPH
jgi:Protein of unknown function (DUF3224)